MPIFVASAPKSETTASICAATRSGGIGSTAATPSVFCAVTAVIAVRPKTPCAANVFRSAWIPAPPPESLPAIVSAVRIWLEFRVMTAHASTGSLASVSLKHSSLAPQIKIGAVVLATSLTAAAAQFTMPLPFTAVPFVLTPMVVLLTGAALGSRLGALSQVLYLVAGAAGLPVFAPSVTLPPGALRLIGPTGGYLLAYPVAAFVTGWLAERGWDRRYLTSRAAMLLGLAIIFAGGVSWLAVGFSQTLTAAFASGLLPFIALDTDQGRGRGGGVAGGVADHQSRIKLEVRSSEV